MTCRPRRIFASLVLALLLTTGGAWALPGVARPAAAGPAAVFGLVERWLGSLWAKAGSDMDPDGQAAPSGNAGSEMDPNGMLTPPSGDEGSDMDPNG